MSMEKLSGRRLRNKFVKAFFSRRRRRPSQGWDGLQGMEPRLYMDALPVISEFMAVNQSTLADEDGQFEDWIEVRNTSSTEPLNLAGYYLTDKAADKTLWAFPSVTIPADGRIVVFASGKNRTDPLGTLHTNFKLDGAGEFLGIFNAALDPVSQFTPEYPEQFIDLSYGQPEAGGSYLYYFSPTPGTPNSGATTTDPTRTLVISEIMYHPVTPGGSTENTALEYIEVYNAYHQDLILDGWRIDSGVSFEFPAMTLGSGQYLVISASPAAFAGRYPGSTATVLGPWTGTLSNSGEKIKITDPFGDVVDETTYADSGIFARRVQVVDSFNQTGWEWQANHDGAGMSLELVNLQFSNDYGHNWAASPLAGGTPGLPNGSARANVAPAIEDLAHFPLVPTSADSVTITARITDDLGATPISTLFWRLDGSSTFTSAAMFDDGLHGDGVAGDGVFGATLIPRGSGTIVEYYVRSDDGQGNLRTYPAPGTLTSGATSQSANALYQVDNSLITGAQPIYRIIMTAAERAYLENLGNGGGTRDSDAQMNATFITIDGTGTSLRHNAGMRIRGAGSRSNNPKNYRVNITSDNPWNGLTALNLNNRFTNSQLIGSAVFRLSGVVTAEAYPVQFRVNNTNLAGAGSPQFGSYLFVEPVNGDYIDNHFPDDNQGNLYKKVRPTTDRLTYLGTNPQSYINAGYSKETNSSLNDWSDLMNMLNVFNNASEANYVQEISQVIDIDQWLRYFAVNSLAGNGETNLGIGITDDFSVYAGIIDKRFKLLMHDNDTLFGQGDGPAGTTSSLFRAAEGSEGVIPSLNRFLHHPEITPRFYQIYVDLINTVFSAEQLDPLMDQLLGPFVPAGTIQSMKTWAAGRNAYVLSQINLAFTAASGLPEVDGYPTLSIGGGGGGTAPNGDITTGLTGYWNFDNSANLGADTSGLGRNASINDGPTYIADPAIGLGAVNMTTGNNDRRVGIPSAAVSIGQGTVSVWAKPTVTSAREHFLFANKRQGFGGSSHRIEVYTDANNNLAIGLGNSHSVATNIFNLPVNQWTHVALTYGNNSFAVFVNGVQMATGAYSNLSNSTNSEPAFGNDGSGNNFSDDPFNGLLDEGRLYSRILNLLDIQTLAYNGGGTGPAGDPDLYTANLSGNIDATRTASVLVNGLPATIDYTAGTWRLPKPTGGGGPSDPTLNLMSSGHIWRYLDLGPDQGTAWRATGFDASSWSMGPSELGYGDGDEATVIQFGPDANNKIVTAYFRSTFQVDDLASITALAMNLKFDDGVAVYINGTEVARNNLAANAGFNDFAQNNAPNEDGYTPFTIPLSAISQGVNTIAVEVHQNTGSSTDLSMDMRLVATLAPPDPRMIAPGADWKYLDNGTDQGTAWTGTGFDDSSWATGPAEFGYGDSDEATTISFGPDTNNKHVTSYFRRTFEYDAVVFDGATLKLKYDDGAAIYINGVEVVRTNLAAGAAYNTFALGDAPDETAFFTFNIPGTAFVDGVNTIAVEIHQSTAASTDVSFDLEMEGVEAGADAALRLEPGINRVLIQAFDGQGNEIHQQWMDVVYSNGETTPLAGTIASNLFLTAADGPYLVSGNLIVASGAALTIEPGATLYFAQGAGITVNGSLDATGSSIKHIRMAPVPGSGTTWAGVQFINSSLDNKLVNVDMDQASSAAQWVRVDHSRLTVDNVIFGSSGTTKTVIASVAGDVQVHGSYFPPVNGASAITSDGIGAGGQFRLDGNIFPAGTGAGAVIQLLNAPQPGPIYQVTGNTLAGGADDGLVILGAGAYIDGNTFVGFHKNNAGDTTSNAVVIDGAGLEIHTSRNIYYNNDHAVLLLNGALLIGQNDTYAGHTIAAIHFDEPNRPVNPGAGALIDSSIFYFNAASFADVYVGHPVEGTTQLSVNRSILPVSQHGLGSGNIDQDPMLANQGLQAGSPAIGAGVNGIDIGHAVGWESTIGGAPTGITDFTAATLTVAGPGIVSYRYRLNGGEWSGELAIDQLIQLTGLTDGNYEVQTVGKNAAGAWQADDQATSTGTWSVQTGARSLKISEILAINTAYVHMGSLADLIELVNEGATAIDLSGMSLTDDPFDPFKHVFPAGTMIQPGERLVLIADGSNQPGHVNFQLAGGGEGVYLHDTSDSGGNLIDSVVFGMQIANYSIGLREDGTWGLTVPTFGAPNVRAATASPMTLTINEWLAGGSVLLQDDFIELYNPAPQPVALGGLYLTDDPLGAPAMHQIAALSFIPAIGFAVFIPDKSLDKGPEHVNFGLNLNTDMIGLMSSSLQTIDAVVFVSQTQDVSQGRAPDGADRVTLQTEPTPGSTNLSTEQVAVSLVNFNNVWRYNDQNLNLGGAWVELEYNDSTWAQGPGIFGFETAALPQPILTPLVANRLTYYFRTTFQVTTDTSAATVQFTLLVDDGAVVYLNGVEVHRLNMSAGAVSFTTPANTTVDNAGYTTFTLPGSMLNLGVNYLAVELHQAAADSSDAVFGMDVDLLLPPPPSKLDQYRDFLRISEVMFNPDDGPEFEFIELINTGALPLNLEGVRLTNGVQFTFPVYELLPGQRTVVAANEAAYRERYGQFAPLAGVFTGNLDNAGERISLSLPEPFIAHILDFTYQPAWSPLADESGHSLKIVNASAAASTWGLAASWQASNYPNGSPGYVDLAMGTDDVVINEILANTAVGIGTWIELRNTTANLISLAGWRLSDSPTDLGRYTVPAGITINGLALRTFFEQTNFGLAGLPGVDSPFKLNPLGGELHLVAPYPDGTPSGYHKVLRYGPTTLEGSIGRVVNSVGDAAYVPLVTKTPNAANTAPRIGQVVINEIHYNPLPGGVEFIELLNTTGANIALSDAAQPGNPESVWQFTDGIEFSFPHGATIRAHSYVLLIPDSVTEAAFRAAYNVPSGVPIYRWDSANFALSNSGDRLELVRPGSPEGPGSSRPGFVPHYFVEAIDFDDAAPWPLAADGTGPSLGRVNTTAYGDDPANWIATSHITPGYGNDVLLGDVTLDGDIDAADIDSVLQAISGGGSANEVHDLNGDGLITQADADMLIQDILNTFYGDLNLDHTVSIGDLVVMATFFGVPGVYGWAQGDLNGTGDVTIGDLVLLASNFGAGAALTSGLTADGDSVESDGAAALPPDLLNGQASAAGEDPSWDHIDDVLAELAGD